MRLEGGRSHRITYTDVLRDLEPINRVLNPWERVTYASLWVHAKRHYNVDGMAAYWSKRLSKELREGLKA